MWFTNMWNNYIPDNCRGLCYDSAALPGTQLQGFSKPTGCTQNTVPAGNIGKIKYRKYKSKKLAGMENMPHSS